MTTYTSLMVNGIEYLESDSITLERSIGEYNTTSNFTIEFNNHAGKYDDTFTLNDEIVVYADLDVNPATTKIFTGVIENIDYSGSELRERITLSGRDYGAVLQDMTIQPIVFKETDIGAIVKGIIEQNAVGVVTTNNVDTSTGIIMERVGYNHTILFDALKQLSQDAGYIFYVDEDKDVHFVIKDGVSSGKTFDNTNITNAEFKTDDTNIFNKVWVYGDRILTGQTDLGGISPGTPYVPPVPAIPASGGLGSAIIGSIAIPKASIRGITYDTVNENLLSADDGTSHVYTHSGISTDLLGSISVTGDIRGITYDTNTGNLITCDNTTNHIYTYSGVSTVLLGSFASPTTSARGLAFDGTNLISNETVDDLTFIHSGISAVITGSYDCPDGNPRGASYNTDLNQLYSCGAGNDFNYVHSGTSSTLLGSFDQVGTASQGMAYKTGSMLYADSALDHIYVVDIDLIPGSPYIPPIPATPGTGSAIILTDKPHNTRVFVDDVLQEKGGVYQMDDPATTAGLKYVVDFNRKSVIFVSGTQAGDNIPASGTNNIQIDYERSVPILKFSQDAQSVGDYGPKTKIITDRDIKDYSAAEVRAASFLSENKDPKTQGDIRVHGIIDVVPGQTCIVNIPFHNVNNETYKILNATYSFTKESCLSDKVLT